MSTVNGSNGDCPVSSDDDDLKFISHSLKCTLSASDRFNRFIQLSSSHGSLMGDNLSTIQSILLEIILKLLSSVKFKFTSLIACNGSGRRSGFTELLYQMDKFRMNDYYHWSLIIEETRQSLDKFSAVNKAKYEDLVHFVHSTLDHITRHNVRLDLQSFAVLFNTVVSTQPPTTMGNNIPPTTLLDFTPLSILPSRCYNVNQVRVIKAANFATPPRSPRTFHSKRSFSTHRRRLNFDALDDDESNGVNVDNDSHMSVDINPSIDYKLIPIELPKFKIYERSESYSYIAHKWKIPLIIPMRLPADIYVPDPRIVNRVVIVQRNQKRSIRAVDPDEETISFNLATADANTDVPIDYSKPAKRKRIIWDLD